MKYFTSKITATQAGLMSILLWVICAAVFHQYLIYRNAKGFLERETKAQTEQLQDLKAVSADLPKFEGELARCDQDLARARSQVPVDPEVGKYVEELNTLGKPLKVKLKLENEQDLLLPDHPGIVSRELTVIAAGRAERIKKFCEAAAKLQRLSRWDEAESKPDLAAYKITVYYQPSTEKAWAGTTCRPLEQHLWLWPYKTWVARMDARAQQVCQELKTYDDLQARLKNFQEKTETLKAIATLNEPAAAPTVDPKP